MGREYQICKRCIMDTTDSDIIFDETGFCNHCTDAIRNLEKISSITAGERQKRFEEIIKKIKKEGAGKKYDCVIGLSGGVDSSYLAFIVKRAGLKPLAVHLDNGWNSELAVQNIEMLVKKLEIDLITLVIDWEEFRELQLAYFKASVIDIEALSDNAIVIAIHNIMKSQHIKYFLIGFNYSTESIMPSSWLYSPKYDSMNIKSIYKKFGSNKKLKTYPLLSFFGYLKYRYFDKSNIVALLNEINYNKDSALAELKKEFKWREYGNKHYESKITQFYQAHILPQKFNIDKRKAHLSSLICSGQISRDEALIKLNEPLYTFQSFEEDKNYFLKKMKLSIDEYERIMASPVRSHFDFHSYNKLIIKLSSIRKTSGNG
jgi:N-acetyl sugar amidotransferase